MLMTKIKKDCHGNKLLTAPNIMGNIWPDQCCPVFEPRDGYSMKLKQCWYCRYADFHLDKPKALEVGICHWPDRIMK